MDKKDPLNIRKQEHFEEAIEKENNVRLAWFKNNEQRLTECAEKPNTKTVPQDIKDDVTQTRQAVYRNLMNLRSVIKPKETVTFTVDEDAIFNVMRPVNPDVKNILYRGAEANGGRVSYLHERAKLIPEKKYYFPETTNFRYGWRMWDNAKTRINLGNGRQQVIRDSFYRRRGVERDPYWYKEPAQLSPTVCNCQ